MTTTLALVSVCPARFDKLNVGQQSNKQQTNNDQRIAAFQITNPGKNAALALLKQIHVMQFYITKYSSSCYASRSNEALSSSRPRPVIIGEAFVC
jgi:hypothetical protein